MEGHAIFPGTRTDLQHCKRSDLTFYTSIVVIVSSIAQTARDDYIISKIILNLINQYYDNDYVNLSSCLFHNDLRQSSSFFSTRVIICWNALPQHVSTHH